MSAGVGYPGVFSSQQAVAAAALPVGYLYDGLVSWSSVSQVQIATGACRSDDDTQDIVIASPLTVNVASTGANGRNVDTAEQASKWYAVCAIKNPTSGVVAGFLINEDDLGGFTYPAGYTVKRRLGWIRNNGLSNFYAGHYHGIGHYRKWLYDEDRSNLIILFSGAVFAPSWGNIDCSSEIPPTSNCGCFEMSYYRGAASPSGVDFRPNGSSIADPLCFQYTNADPVSMPFELTTDSAQIIQYQNHNNGDFVNVYIRGWYDMV